MGTLVTVAGTVGWVNVVAVEDAGTVVAASSLAAAAEGTKEVFAAGAAVWESPFAEETLEKTSVAASPSAEEAVTVETFAAAVVVEAACA